MRQQKKEGALFRARRLNGTAKSNLILRRFRAVPAGQPARAIAAVIPHKLEGFLFALRFSSRAQHTSNRL